jgi:hypothetical protein
MKKNVIFTFILIIAALLLSTCTTQPQPTTTRPQSTSPPTEPSDYQLRVELTCTTDWANLQIVNNEHVFSTNIVSVSGSPTKQDAGKGGIGLGQSLDSAEAGGEVGIVVDYAIAAQASGEGLAFKLQKGNINGCLVQIFHLVGGDYQLAHEVDHQGVYGVDGMNTLEFTLDLNTMAEAVAAESPIITADDYHVRIEFICTTDWANLQIKSPQQTLSTSLVSVLGHPSSHYGGIGGMSVNQSLSSAMGEESVGLTVDYVFPQSSGGGLIFRLQKGDLKGCNVRLYYLQDGDYRLVDEVDHYAVSDTDTFNTLDFSFDLDTMAEIPISSDHCSRYDNLGLEVVLHTIGPDDTTMTMYVQFPNEVIGMQGGGPPLVYDALLGDSSSIDCRVFKGEQYFGRLYCFHNLRSEMKNTNQPWTLFVSGCQGEVFEVPLLSLQVTKPEKEKTSGSEKEKTSDVNSCGPEPDQKCTQIYYEWCVCTGGSPVCNVRVDEILYEMYCFP